MLTRGWKEKDEELKGTYADYGMEGEGWRGIEQMFSRGYKEKDMLGEGMLSKG